MVVPSTLAGGGGVCASSHRRLPALSTSALALQEYTVVMEQTQGCVRSPFATHLITTQSTKSCSADCSWSYIGETGRCLKTRLSEHIRNTKAF